MFTKKSVRWIRPEDRTLVLTYDDGPGRSNGGADTAGPRTLELAEYLHEENIQATFFVIGKHAVLHVDILTELAELGHLVANHTYNHPAGDVSGWAGNNVDHLAEIKRTDEIIKPYVKGNFFFRSPGGTPWPASKPRLVDELNGDPDLRQYIGPVAWNIESQDWTKWRDKSGAVNAADHIWHRIVEGRGGIVLMHDCSTECEAELRNNNRALEVARILVPKLVAAGYQFKRLDQVPLGEF